MNTSETLLQTIQDKIKWADSESEQHGRRKKDMEEKTEDLKKLLKVCIGQEGAPPPAPLTVLFVCLFGRFADGA